MKINKLWTRNLSALFAAACLVACGGGEDLNVDTVEGFLVEDATGDRAECGVRPEVLAEHDTDGDGELSREERSAAREARKAQILAEYDLDNSGRLDSTERASLMTDKRTARFAELDANTDGILVASEVESSCRLSRAFERIDADANGEISTDEFVNARGRHKEKGRRGEHRRGDRERDGERETEAS